MEKVGYRYFLKLSYIGTNYHGWQKQPAAITVQAVVEDALSKVFREQIGVLGAGRTDTGVHARDYYAHFDSIHSFDSIKNMQLQFKLNRILPADVAVHDVLPVKHGSHARFNALSRTYKYFICTTKDPYQIPYSWLYERHLDIKAMQEAATMLKQHQNFSCFAKSKTQVKTDKCHVHLAEWVREDHMIIFKITADRFLRNMVRAIVGTLIDVGLHKISLDDFLKIIESRNRSNAGYSVPACGLHLTEIKYPESIFLYKPINVYGYR